MGPFSHVSMQFRHLSKQFKHLSMQFRHLSKQFRHLLVMSLCNLDTCLSNLDTCLSNVCRHLKKHTCQTWSTHFSIAQIYVFPKNSLLSITNYCSLLFVTCKGIITKSG